MATVYILYSVSEDQYYIGSCNNIELRVEQHNTKYYKKAFTSKTDDWILFYHFDNLPQILARKIETHIKKMKSRAYINNLKKYPEIIEKLIVKYTGAGPPR